MNRATACSDEIGANQPLARAPSPSSLLGDHNFNQGAANHMVRSIYFLVSHSSAGGAQEIWANLAEAFRDRGHRVRLMALYPPPGDTIRETPPDLPWQYVAKNGASGPLGLLGVVRRLASTLRQDRPDLIVSALPAGNVVAALAARLAGLEKRVVFSHHTAMETYPKMLERLDSLAGSLSSVKAIVGVSETVSKSFGNKPHRYRVKRRTIHNALPPYIENLLLRLSAQRQNRPAGGRKVVATGRLAGQKNYPLLIRAAVHLPDVQIDIVGSGPDEQALKALASELGVAERVHFLGHRPRADAMEVLAGGDVFVQVSLFEGHSLALIEAAKLGLPLIVSDVPVQIEGITKSDGELCGIAVGTQDEIGLAKAIIGLLDDPDAMALRARQSRELGEEATFEAMVDAYCEFVP